MTCGCPSDRGVVPSREASAPPPAVGLPLARSGGHAAAHSPEQALFVPESFPNRYRLWPSESTRIVPSPVLATLTVAELRPAAFAVGVDVPPLLPLLPQPAATSAKSAAIPAAERSPRGLLRVMVAPLRWKRTESSLPILSAHGAGFIGAEATLSAAPGGVQRTVRVPPPRWAHVPPGGRRQTS